MGSGRPFLRQRKPNTKKEPDGSRRTANNALRHTRAIWRSQFGVFTLESVAFPVALTKSPVFAKRLGI